MTNNMFCGVFTALVTPFTGGNEIDYPSLKKLLQRQVEAGVNGLVIMGTSGESPVIYGEEMDRLVGYVLQEVGDKLAIVVGTGNNDTAHTVKETQAADKLGAHGLMLVNPYYNKPTQEGLFQHFSMAARSTKLPVMLYNIPGRTAVNIAPATMLRLIEANANIRAVKEASGDLGQMGALLREAPADFAVLSGDDSLTLPLMALGGRGVVSVLGNLRPRVMVDLVTAINGGNWSRARQLHLQWLPLMEGLLSIGNNPLAVKTLLSMAGFCAPQVRLPLYPLGEAERNRLQALLQCCEGWERG